MIFAQLSQEMVSGIPAIIVSVAACLWLWNQWGELSDRRERRQNPKLQIEQPIEFTRAKDHVAKNEFERAMELNRREHENLFSKIGGVERGAAAALEHKFEQSMAAGEESREKLHGRVNEILIVVSRLEGEVKARFK